MDIVLFCTVKRSCGYIVTRSETEKRGKLDENILYSGVERLDTLEVYVEIILSSLCTSTV
jgi:hypothetical protein